MAAKTYTFQYHGRDYQLVKGEITDYASWTVYAVVNKQRGDKQFSFTDTLFSPKQAEMVAKYCLLNYDSGVIAGRAQAKNEIKNLVDTYSV